MRGTKHTMKNCRFGEQTRLGGVREKAQPVCGDRSEDSPLTEERRLEGHEGLPDVASVLRCMTVRRQQTPLRPENEQKKLSGRLFLKIMLTTPVRFKKKRKKMIHFYCLAKIGLSAVNAKRISRKIIRISTRDHEKWPNRKQMSEQQYFPTFQRETAS